MKSFFLILPNKKIMLPLFFTFHITTRKSDAHSIANLSQTEGLRRNHDRMEGLFDGCRKHKIATAFLVAICILRWNHDC